MALNNPPVHGNRVLIQLNGITVGAGVQSLRTSNDFGIQDLDGIGSALTQEFVPGKFVYTLTLSKVAFLNTTLQKLGIEPNPDTLVVTEFSIMVIDRILNQNIAVYNGCVLANSSTDFNKHTLSLENATFRAKTKQQLG